MFQTLTQVLNNLKQTKLLNLCDIKVWYIYLLVKMYTTSAFVGIRDFVVFLLNKSTRCSPRITAEQLYACKQFVAFVLQKTLDI